MVEATVKALGGIDILDNNVGIVRVGGPLEIDEADWDRVAAVNLKSAFLVCSAVIPQMLRRGGGAIVNISSIAGIRHTGVDYGTYATTTGALNPFSRAKNGREPSGERRGKDVLVPWFVVP